MYIYNVTINVEESIHNQWLQWMKNEHIPAMLKTGKFLNALMSKVNVNEEMGGITYSVQYKTPDQATLKQYYEEDAKKMRAQSKPFEGKFVAFRTELEIVDEQE
ncbi:MAG: DUF4286 family protein [Psychroflexus sp.]